MGSLLKGVSGVRWGELRDATGATAGGGTLCCPGSHTGMRIRLASPLMTWAMPYVRWGSSLAR